MVVKYKPSSLFHPRINAREKEFDEMNDTFLNYIKVKMKMSKKELLKNWNLLNCSTLESLSHKY